MANFRRKTAFSGGVNAKWKHAKIPTRGFLDTTEIMAKFRLNIAFLGGV